MLLGKPSKGLTLSTDRVSKRRERRFIRIIRVIIIRASKHPFGIKTKGTSENKYEYDGTNAQYNCSHSSIDIIRLKSKSLERATQWMCLIDSA